MADEKRLIDADKTQKVLENMSEHLREVGRSALASAIGYAAEVISEQPTVDAVEVVRCKDCAKCSIIGERYVCDRHANIMAGIKVGLEATSPCHFCADGERRGDNGHS